jgi:hypothetical protein
MQKQGIVMVIKQKSASNGSIRSCFKHKTMLFALENYKVNKTK